MALCLIGECILGGINLDNVSTIFNRERHLFARLAMQDLYDYRGIDGSTPGFPFFDLMSPKEMRLESRVRDVLINNVLISLLEAKGIRAYRPDSAMKEGKVIPFVNNTGFEAIFEFEFIIKTMGKVIGIRYTDVPYSKEGQFINNPIDEIIILDWAFSTGAGGKDTIPLPDYKGKILCSRFF